MNWLADMDWGWRPLLFLRPPKNQDIDNSVLLKMTGFFGPFTGLLVFLLRFRQIESVTATGIALNLFLGSLGFFLLYKFTFATFWNRRARRLRSNQIRHESATE